MAVLEVKDLHKSFGSKTVLDGLTFSVSEGSVFGFIGRNGAGKTTTMKIILGLLKADSGEVTVCGEKVTYGGTAANRFIGYLPDVSDIDLFLALYSLCKDISVEVHLFKIGKDRLAVLDYRKGSPYLYNVALSIIQVPQYKIRKIHKSIVINFSVQVLALKS